MPPKRAGKPLSGKKAEKVPRLMNQPAMNVNSGIERATTSQIKELERALEQNDNNSRVLHLAREVAKAPNLPPNLTTRLLTFCVKVGSEYVVRQLLDNQAVDVNTREGGELLWAAIAAGQDEIAAMMVHRGGDLTVRKSGDNRTLLHGVLRSDEIKNDTRREELARLMLKHGADVNARDADCSVLNVAIRQEECSSALVEELLDRGADVTISEAYHLDDIFLACDNKLELLPRLIQHQVPDEETRNRRGIIAIDNLIFRKYTGTRLAAAVKMIKRILDLGVPVDGPHPFPESRDGKRPFSLLIQALRHKKQDAIKILLDYGADPHQKDESGHTPLFRATSFKGYTHASRWLIEKGASIHDRNDDGCYPIHGACLSQSLRNIHLFLNLGADLNVADNEGRTPFRFTGNTFNFNEAHYLIIKHFALIEAEGGEINGEDKALANRYAWDNGHYRKCTAELERMKAEKICDGISYFSLFSKNMFSLIQLMKNKNFVSSFKRNEKKRADRFPVYSYMLLHSFKIAMIRYKMLLEEMKHVQQAFGEAVSDCVIEKITYYLCLEKLKHCQNDYYMSLHATLKNTKADKAKIL